MTKNDARRMRKQNFAVHGGPVRRVPGNKNPLDRVRNSKPGICRVVYDQYHVPGGRDHNGFQNSVGRGGRRGERADRRRVPLPDIMIFMRIRSVNADYRCPLLNQLEMSGVTEMVRSIFWVTLDILVRSTPLLGNILNYQT